MRYRVEFERKQTVWVTADGVDEDDAAEAAAEDLDGNRDFEERVQSKRWEHTGVVEEVPFDGYTG